MWLGLNEIYGITNMDSFLRGSADLVVKCEGIKLGSFCLGKMVLITAGP